ncbi:tRNA-dihydrouridine(16/17) synthase [NAD(P)(+)]-like [Mizuhopecten yessoensis]|uniref:tRNA-dihydrouridine(16/17) synthase [NAD(P)(+)]-like n=1 Tax=Mizuhopecten yessoensis TaxID=6573 RepID=A0A210QSZ7_MIZYE|nr:tRNA-dihydrouridine(16/17) synthase [NAD(P)(+)]-like [Mizuhopecten yessoensis]XP_021350647.1 tRNA-dihydrouridine(16/17) synthase [NAD(P)(+)]-like [Mizuhopecten yessoensis]OWF51864.1 tRNA-dihydrouridine(16/17) synthase [NAD(P)(+)]-like [Mizuhopecten yessoensis]
MVDKIGGYEFWRTTLSAAKYVVAPMVDQSELAWRMLSRRYGAELCYTPMLHSSVFNRDQRYRTEALQSCPEDKPLIVQFCANDPETFLKAALLAEDHCDAIDLNLGCPQVIAKRGHYGAFLQDEWELLEKMVKLCHERLKVPITCKVRIFESMEKTIEYAQMLEKAGCQILTVHGRTKEQKGPKTGLADWQYIKAVRDNVKIPVFGNGNIQYLSDVKKCLEETGVDGIMTAEGNLHNPALFLGIDPPIWKMAEEYLELVDKYPCPLSYVRGHLFKLFHHGLVIHEDIRLMVGTGKSLDSLKLAVLRMKERCLKDMEKSKTCPEMFESKLPHPYWICQPYVRPSPEEAEENQKRREATKRPLDLQNIPADMAGMSKNKIKKKIKNPHKSFDGTKKAQYEKCDSCLNPRGKKCAFGRCKNCCKNKTRTETLDCVGHGIYLKSKLELKEQCDNKKKELDLLEQRLTGGSQVEEGHQNPRGHGQDQEVKAGDNNNATSQDTQKEATVTSDGTEATDSSTAVT